MKERCKNLIDEIKDVYSRAPARIISDYRREKANLAGYQGREILELLQNAVDELEDTSDATVEISIIGNILKVCNNGRAFSFEGFQSLIYSDYSPKFQKDNYIGNKGTGFRSILNWAEKIKIYSGELAVEFSEIQAKKFLDELLSYESVKKYCSENNIFITNIAILTAPYFIEKLVDQSFDTVIEIYIKENMLDKVRSQLNDIAPETILFLPRIKNLTIKDNLYTKIFKKLIINNKEDNHSGRQDVLIEIIKDDETVESEKWTVVERQGLYHNKKYNVKVAYRNGFKALVDNRLYSYFRTKIPMPINALVHATLDLTADRNSLNESEDNAFILNALCDLIAELAEDLCVSPDVSYNALEILAPVGDFPPALNWSGFSFRDSYYAKIAAKNVFPTVNQTYISFEPQPKFYKENFAKFLRGNPAEHLLLHTSNTNIQEFLYELAKSTGQCLEYKYNKIVDAINFALPKLSIEYRAELWLLFTNKFSHIIKDNDIVPKFALDENEQIVNVDTRIFFPPENVQFPLPPKFAKIVFLNRALLKALQNLPELKNASLTTVYEKLSIFKNIHQYRLNEVIRFVNNYLQNESSRIKKRNKKRKNHNNNHQVEFLIWLWKLYQSKYLKDDSTALPDSVVFPDRKGIMREASSLYLGYEFGNPVTENLYPGQTNKFAGKPTFLAKADINEVNNFLHILGIREFPIIVKREIDLRNNEDYKKYLVDNISLPLKTTGGGPQDSYNTPQEIKDARLSSVKVMAIDGLEEILTTSSTKSILGWISNDSNLRKSLEKYEDRTSEGRIQRGNQWNDRIIPGQHLPSYLRYVFATSKWIEIDGARYSPDQCLLSGKIGTRFAPYLVNPNLEQFTGKSNCNNNLHFIHNILASLGAPSDYTNLNTETFYRLLLALPDKDKDGKISRAVYNLLVKKGLSKKLDKDNLFYKKFIKEGKVYCKTTGKFEPVEEVRYLMENISNALQKKFKLIDIHIRQNSELIQDYFGVFPLSVKGELEGIPEHHPANTEFKTDFKNFLPYAFCKRLKQLESEKESRPESYEKLATQFKNIDVDICQNAMVKYDDEIFKLEENEFLVTKDRIYLCAPRNCENLAALKGDLKFCSAIADIFRSRSGSKDDALYQFVRTAFSCYTSAQRDALILEDFGSLEALELPRDLLNMTASTKEIFMAACVHFNKKKIGEELQALIDKLQFADLATKGNAPYLIKILKQLNINVVDFNSQSGLDLNLIPWFEDQIIKLLEANRKAYKNGLFVNMQAKLTADKKTFKEILNKYDINAFEIKNDVFYDPKAEFYVKFGTHCNTITDIDADACWLNNLKKFEKTIGKTLPEEFLVDPVFDSMLYFNEEPEMKKMYQAKEIELSSQEPEKLLISNIDLNQVEVTRIKTHAPIELKQSKPRQHSLNTAGFNKKDNQEERGGLAEEIVYKIMKANHESYKYVEWISENAKKRHCNPDGEAGVGYDLKYIDSVGNEKFVEVKSSTGSEIVFIMSNNELNVAEKNPEKYEIWFVASVLDNPTIQIISDLFKYDPTETRLNNNKFTCSAGQWTIKCQNNGKK